MNPSPAGPAGRMPTPWTASSPSSETRPGRDLRVPPSFLQRSIPRRRLPAASAIAARRPRGRRAAARRSGIRRRRARPGPRPSPSSKSAIWQSRGSFPGSSSSSPVTRITTTAGARRRRSKSRSRSGRRHPGAAARAQREHDRAGRDVFAAMAHMPARRSRLEDFNRLAQRIGMRRLNLHDGIGTGRQRRTGGDLDRLAGLDADWARPAGAGHPDAAKWDRAVGRGSERFFASDGVTVHGLRGRSPGPARSARTAPARTRPAAAGQGNDGSVPSAWTRDAINARTSVDARAAGIRASGGGSDDRSAIDPEAAQ